MSAKRQNVKPSNSSKKETLPKSEGKTSPRMDSPCVSKNTFSPLEEGAKRTPPVKREPRPFDRSRAPKEGHIPYSVPWQWGLDNGLINPTRANGKEYYHIIHRKYLDTAIERYKAGNESMKARVRREFEGYITNAAGQTPLPEREHNVQLVEHAGREVGRVEHAGQVGHPVWHLSHPHPHPQMDEYPPLPHIPLWKEGMELGLIGDKCYFHRNIPGFITASELKMLLDQYKMAPGSVKAEMRTAFMENIDGYNASIPKTLKCLKVYAAYINVWGMAEKEGLIAPEVTYKAEYAEWVPDKVLIGYVQTIDSLSHSSDRQRVRETIADSLNEKFAQADRILQNRQKYAAMDFADLLRLSTDYAPYETKQAFATCTTCVKYLDKADVIAALTSWRALSEEQEKARYKRWYEYRKYVHAHKCAKECA